LNSLQNPPKLSVPCKICGRNYFSYIGRPRYNPDFPRCKENDYRILQCQYCRYYFVFPEIDLTREEWQKLYASNYFNACHKTRWHEQLRQKERVERLKLILKHLNVPRGRFLDMGCGEGLVLDQASALGFETYGLDIVNNLSPCHGTQSQFYWGDIFQAQFPDDYFSAIYMDSVLEHLTNPLETINELKRVLRPGGVLLIVVPNEDSLENDVKKLAYSIVSESDTYGRIKPFYSPFHIQGFTTRTIKVVCRMCGLRLLELREFGGKYTFWKDERFGTKAFWSGLVLNLIGLVSIINQRQIQLLILASK